MRKYLIALLVLGTYSASAQTLFTYGKNAVTVKEFLHAYKKNNTATGNEKTFREYLDLYISSRLKIREAKQRGYDTLSQVRNDITNLRQQILPQYLNDKESVDRLVNEAFTRSQKNIHLAHIFISFKQGTPEQLSEAKKKLTEVANEIKKGTSFNKIAQEYSDDPSAKSSGGNLGWITAFNLPYELENLAYSTPAGKTSAVHESKAGYHIFKNIEERKAVGRIRASEILLAFPPDASAEYKAELKKRADSLYNRLQQGDDFGKLASQFSNDMVSAASNGQIPEFGIGEFDPLFESTVYSLADEKYSKPFLTSHGYHIVKKLAIIPINTDSKEPRAMQLLKDKVEQSDRIKSTQSELAKKLLLKMPVGAPAFSVASIAAYTDSILDHKKALVPVLLKNESTLLQIAGKKYTAVNWLEYAQQHRFKADGSGVKSTTSLWDEFKNEKVLDYYQDHLEDYNEEFHNQLKEFEEGNLFFEIMQRQVWTPAQSDTLALYKYYQQHKENYRWHGSADAILFISTDATTMNEFFTKVKQSPQNWHQTILAYSDKINFDSSRFELSQLHNYTKDIKPLMVTPILADKNQSGSSFAYILKLYPQTEQQSFTEAKGAVINDYQTQLEQQWLAGLKKKYPVVINKKAVQEIISKKQF